MAKKRQADFAKTQLKPGRPVGKKKNVTNTEFKATKIIVRPSKAQNLTAKTIGDCLRAIKTKPKDKDFDDLIKLIGKDINSLLLHLPDIFNCVFKMILDTEGNKGIAAVEVVSTIFTHTTDLQIHSFIPRFINVLSCAMTHSRMRIKEQALKLLNCMLQTHPNLICHSMNILSNLLQMLTGSPRKWTHSQLSNKSSVKHSLDIMYSDNIYSPDWRIHVLGHINLFLTEMLKDKSAGEDQDYDEQEVYWNCEGPLHLEIYEGGGLKPVDIEKSLLSNFDYHDLYFDDSGSIEAFIDGIINLLPELFNEEMASETKFDDNLVSRGSIVNLSILFQVLSKVSEWMHLISYDEMDSVVKKFLQEKVWGKGRFPFCQRGMGFQEPSVERLNLSVCFLFGKFLLESGNDIDNLNDSIFSYVMTVFKMPYAIRYDSIPMLVKIMKIYFGMRETSEVLEFLRSCLTQMCSLLKGSNDNPNEQLLSSLFIKMSLDSAYHFLAETDAMKHWFNWLLNQLTEIPRSKDKSKINKNLLNVIKKIANRKYPCFLELLQKNDLKIIKALLKYDNDDVRDAAIFLIYNLKDINASVLENLSCLILTDSTFPTKFAVRLIRLLTYRFSEKLAINEPIPEASIYKGRGLVNIIQFLLNIAVDSFSINSEKWTDYEANEYTKAMKICKDATAFTLFPSLHWKKHSVLFQVCVRFLNQLDKNVVNNVATRIIKEILENTTVLPMHSAIAILRLFKHEKNERYFGYQMCDLMFCSLLTTSILTHMSTEDEWYKWNVVELMNSMELEGDIALKTLEHIQYLKDDQIDGIVGYHILRVLKFYLESQLLDPKHYPKVMQTMEILEDKTSDKTIGQQPLYISLYNHFHFYCDL